MSLLSVIKPPGSPVESGLILAALFEIAGEYCDETGRAGGHFCLANERAQPVMIHRVEFTPFPPGWAIRTLDLCQEKVQRLLNHPEHRTSWESRDETKNRFPGAISINGGFISFSGLPPDCDEALVVRLSVLFSALGPTSALHIAELTGNTRITRQVLNKDAAHWSSRLL